MNHITIIGGGLSGSLLALNLIRHASSADAIRIKLIDRGTERDLGPAYSTNEEYLLLNVPAERMGAFSEDPGHFLKWAQKRGVLAGKWDFLSRKLYREYIQELIQHSLQEKKGNITLERIQGEVTEIKMADRRAKIFVQHHGNFFTDKVVLALGNFPPRNPPVKNRSFLNSKRYIQNPWSQELFSFLLPEDTVFFIGTGQTMVDLAISLHKRQHKGKIIAISRHGYLPMAHKNFEVYPSFYEKIKDLKNTLEILRIIRKHFDKAEKMGIDRRAVFDSLRPDTQELWMGLPLEEKNKFLHHLFRYWEIIRSRIPPQSEVTINQMRASGQLSIIAGRITDLVTKENAIEVYYKPLGNTLQLMESANLLINCIGPEVDYDKIYHPLVENLISQGLIHPDPLHLGINALPNGAVIKKDGTASDVFYTLGPVMKGILWECIAVPEIRVQAEKLALLLLKS